MALLFGMMVSRPSCSSSRIASRIGPRERPSLSATGISLMRSPGAIQPFAIASRSASAATSTLDWILPREFHRSVSDEAMRRFYPRLVCGWGICGP